jgi:hypothetical protein
MRKGVAVMATPKERRTASGAIELPDGEPESVPVTMAGRWIAWSADGLRIVGSGATLKKATAAAEAAGESDPIFERVGGATLT